MSKIGNHVAGLQESADYQFGWNSAERGEPTPLWEPGTAAQTERLLAQRMGWSAFHTLEQST